MRQPSLLTKVGATTDVRAGGDVVLIHEPETGATLRTKGRLYVLCEVVPPSPLGRDVAREVADLVKGEYYYDLSAGIEVSLRRALRNANRRAASRLRDQRKAVTIHCACAIVVNSELYAARVGKAQIFLVRRARLFLPGDEPGELADFVHRTTVREAASLGAEPDLLPPVWRQTIEPGDTVILAGGALVDGLGADALKSAAVTLHPRAAAEHIHNRFVADGVEGTDPAVFIEVAPATGAAQRLPAAPEPVEAPEVRIADSIRSAVDAIWRRRPRVDRAVLAAAAPAGQAVAKTLAVGIELLPRRRPPPLRAGETARERTARQQRLTLALAAALLLVTALIGTIVVRDYQSNQVVNDYRVQVVRAEEDIASANRLMTQQRPDLERARERLASASARLDDAARSPAAEPPKIATLRTQIDALSDKLANVVFDLSRANPSSKPAVFSGTPNGLYVVDPGAGALWRVFGEPPAVEARALLQRGQRGVGVPVAVAAQESAIFAIDDGRHVFRAEGNAVADVSPKDAATRWKAVDGMAVFLDNLYVLDAQSGQVWKHEAGRNAFDDGIAYLATPLAPGTARSIAVNGDVWIVTTSNEIQRYRRNPLAFTANRADFAPRWQGDAPHPTAIQALDSQSLIYVLDAPGRLLLQMARDGRELARFALPASLPEPSAFYVDEAAHLAYTLHGTKIVRTDASR